MSISPPIYDYSSTYWNKFRNFLIKHFKIDKISHSAIYNLFIILLVFANTICIIIYSTIDFSNPDNDSIINGIETADTIFNSIYIADVCFKIVAYGINAYFNDPWC